MSVATRITFCVLAILAVSPLASCAADSVNTKQPTSTQSSTSAQPPTLTQSPAPEVTPSVTASATPAASPATPESQSPAPSSSGNLLSAEQKAQLTQLPIPIVAPSDLPPGFRLVTAEGEKGQYANGDDDSGYSLIYLGDNNTCLTIISSKDGPRGQPAQVVETKLGTVKVFTETFQGNSAIYSYIPIAGNPSLRSGGSLPDTKGGWKSCNALSMEAYIQVLKSLEVVK